MKTALWVLPVSDLGGVARHVLDVVRSGLPGYRLVVLLPEGPLADELRLRGAAVVTSAFGQEAGLATSVSTARAMIRTLRPDVVHSHLAWADLVVAFATPLRDSPRVVTTEHGIAQDDLVYHGSRLRSRVKAAAHHARLRRVDAAIAVSASTAEVMRAKWRPTVPIRVVLNGVDRPVDIQVASGLRVASISRLAPEKRVDAVLRAFALLHQRRPEATLVIAGTGPLEDELRGLAEELGVAGSVSFPGHVNAAELMRESDVLVQLSVWENASYSLLDAVVNGLGVVATPVGGNPEILPPDCLVDATDASTVSALLEHQGERLADRPNLPSDWPTVGQMCRQITEIYEQR